jgi:putative glutamine amidotransferase
VATAHDGTVEAIEDPARPFLVGVQWHAEAMVALPPHLALFEGLVEVARAPRLALAA